MERFLDTPVKRYSSGMYVRLAFAVAAHLEPEILVVDEVLAVGDAQFQEKCLGKMKEAGKHGRTVLFVSHNIGAIRQLCSKALLLNKGQTEQFGLIDQVVETYLNIDQTKSTRFLQWPADRAPGDADLRLLAIKITDGLDEVNSAFSDSKEIIFEFELLANQPINSFALSCIIRNSSGNPILHSHSNIKDQDAYLKEGRNHIKMKIPAYLLRSGKYFISISGHVPHVKTFFTADDTISFDIKTKNPEILRYPSTAWQGSIGPAIVDWQTNI